MNGNARLLVALSLGLGILSGPGLLNAKPPTQEQITEAVEKYQAAARENREDVEARYAAAAEAFGSLNFSDMTVDQLKQLRSFGSMLPAEKAKQALDRLAVLAADKGVDGVTATMLRSSFVQSRRPGMSSEEASAAMREFDAARTETVLATLKHPGLHEAMKGEAAGEVFSMLSSVRPSDLVDVKDKLIGLERTLGDELPANVFARVLGYFQIISSEELKVAAADQERIRRRLVAIADRSLDAIPAEGDRAATERRSVQRVRDYLDGAFARGQLVGFEAPKLDFTWSSTDKPIKTLADLKGNVVVIDFWATWCGPCVASFPQVRELVAHYQGYPVVVLGVTSIQGSHTVRKSGERTTERIDTKDDPEKELALMPEFMREMEMTWPVVFSKQDVFNPDFGVRGIPHVAIIDPAGKVRYRGLHPASPAGRALEDKAEKIDGLLREFGLPTPPPVGGDGEAAVTGR